MISADTLKELLDYDPTTGKLIWKHRARKFFPTDNAFNRWNGKNAGNEAFTSVDNYGYRQGNLLGTHYRAHRLIWTLYHGKEPDGFIDHINHDRLDNRIENLRDVPKRENHLNMRRRANGRPLGVKKVASSRWATCIFVNWKTHYLGTFDTEAEALAARKAAERKHGFHENHGKA